MPTMKLPEFAGFGINYDENQKPFFQSQVLEVLRKVASVDLGKELLDGIAKASPRSRTASSALRADYATIDFPLGINVVITPAETMQFVQSGFKQDKQYGSGGAVTVTGLSPSAHAAHNPSKCAFYAVGGSAAMAIDNSADGNGQGSCSILCFTNAQLVTSKGEAAYPFIVVAHELIHSYHHATGTIDSNDEELITSGIGKYADLKFTENAFRKAFGLALRVEY